MFCTNCGNEIEQHARFCSKCGQDVSAVAAAPHPTAPVQPKTTARDMNMHINILGWLLVGSGILTGIIGMIVLFVSRLIPRLPMGVQNEIEIGVPLAAWIVYVVAMAILATAAATAAAGVGLLQYKAWARVFAIVVAVLMVFHFPIGTAVAVYAFWVLFSREGERYYKQRSESTMTANGA
jgi:hypothetical protein